MLDTAVTLKYDKGHWKWYEQVKLNKKCHHAKFDIYHIYGVWINPNIKVFDKPWDLINENMLSLFNTHHSHTYHNVHNLFNICSNHSPLKLQRTRIQNMQFAVCISDTHVTLKQNKVIKPRMTIQTGPKHGNNHAKFERLCFNGVWEKGNVKVFFKRGNMSIISLEHARK